MATSGKKAFRAMQTHCMSKDGAVEEYPWGHTAWKVKGKLFAIGTEGGTHVTVKSSLEKQAVLIQHPKIEIASHVGRFGWVTVNANDADTLELAKELIDESYEAVAWRRSTRKTT